MKKLILTLLLSPLLIGGISFFSPLSPALERLAGFERYAPIGYERVQAKIDDEPTSVLVVLDRWTNKLCTVADGRVRELR